MDCTVQVLACIHGSHRTVRRAHWRSIRHREETYWHEYRVAAQRLDHAIRVGRSHRCLSWCWSILTASPLQYRPLNGGLSAHAMLLLR